MDSHWARILEQQDYVFILIYTIEAAMKILAYGSFYFMNNWHRLDFIIVFGSWMGFFFEALGISMLLRVMRVFRVMRISRIVQHIHSLKAIISTLANSFVNVLNISVLLFVVFFMFAVIGMQLYGHTRFGKALTPDNNFKDFGNALIVLCRVAFGDFVSLKQDCSVQPPLCTSESSSDSESDCGVNEIIANIYFMSFITIATYVFLNLFVAVIMENFTFM